MLSSFMTAIPQIRRFAQEAAIRREYRRQLSPVAKAYRGSSSRGLVPGFPVCGLMLPRVE